MENGTTGLRQRRTGIKKAVENLDLFEKVVDNVKEEKKVSSGIVSLICFIVIFLLVFGELHNHFAGERDYEYRFDVDTDYTDTPILDIDMVIATPCNNLQVVSSLDQSVGLFSPVEQTIKKDPTRFEFTDEEQMFWAILRHAHDNMNKGGIRGIEELQYVDSDVEGNLERLADEKQKQESEALAKERKNKKKSSEGGFQIFMVGNGMGMFQIVASNGADEGTACRVHGKFPVRKGKEEKIVMTIGNAMGIVGLFGHEEGKQSGNISHRIEKFSFGRRISGLVAPLAGAEQISISGQDLYRYFIKVVPTKIYHGLFGGFTMTYQYSVTFLKKKLKEGEHSHGGIMFEYEFAATVIEVRESDRSLLILLVRLCAVVGGVFASSSIINSIIQLFLSLFSPSKKIADVIQSPNTDRIHLLNSDIRVH